MWLTYMRNLGWKRKLWSRFNWWQRNDLPWPVTTHEFKNLAAGRLEVMFAVPNHSKFEWAGCTVPECTTSVKHKLKCTRVGTVEKNVGPDAKSPVWNFDHQDIIYLKSSSGKRKRNGESNDKSEAASPSSTPSHSWCPQIPFAAPRPDWLHPYLAGVLDSFVYPSMV